jgi:hypothetical protein
VARPFEDGNILGGPELETAFADLENSADPARYFRCAAIDGLFLTIAGGVSRGVWYDETEIELDPESDNYVQLNPATGEITLGDGEFEAGREPLFFAVTDDASVTNSAEIDGASRFDRRSIFATAAGDGGGDAGAVTHDIAQTGHGLAVANWVRLSGTSYVKAQADGAANAESVGVVVAVADVDNFTLQTGGFADIFTGLTPGAVQFLSAATAGAQTETAPSTNGQVVKPLAIAASATDAYIVNMRGELLASDGDYLVASNNLGDVANAATAFSNIKQAASETATGVVELATTSEATTGTDTTRAVTPAGLKAVADTKAAIAYVDAELRKLDAKVSCRAATTANITLSSTQTIDGVSVIAGDRVLVKDQSTGADNGIYVCAAGSWSRAADADASDEVTPNMNVFVEEGTANGDKFFRLTTDAPITMGSTSLTFADIGGGSGVTSVSGSAPVSSTGGTTPTISLNVTGLTEDTTPADDDLFLSYDTSAAAFKKVQRKNALGRVAEGRADDAATNLCVPGVELSTVATASTVANRLYYEPFLVTSPITIDQLSVEVTGAGAGSTTARIGIYNADTDWQPTSLVVDGGTVAVDSTGVKSASISQALLPGRYLFCVYSDGTPTLRIVRGGSRVAGLDSAMGASPFTQSLYVSRSYSALPSTGDVWSSRTQGSTPFQHFVVARIASFN